MRLSRPSAPCRQPAKLALAVLLIAGICTPGGSQGAQQAFAIESQDGIERVAAGVASSVAHPRLQVEAASSGDQVALSKGPSQVADEVSRNAWALSLIASAGCAAGAYGVGMHGRPRQDARE